jgi:hypothetical protein
MSYPIPFAKAGEKNTKNLAIFVLKEKHPLSVQEIYDNLRENFEPDITYQAARKSVLSLVEQGIVSGFEGKYELNREWISNLKEFSRGLEVDYDPNKPIHLLDIREGETKVVKFNTIMITPYYWFLDEVYLVSRRRKRKSDFVGYFYGIWPITMVNKEEFEKIKEVFGKYVPHVIDVSNNSFSRDLVGLWKNSFGGEYRLGIDLGREELLLFEDFVIRKIDVPSTLDKYLQIIIKSTPGHLGRLYKMVFSMKAPVTFVITRNRRLSEKMRKEYLKKYFRTKKTKAKAPDNQ